MLDGRFDLQARVLLLPSHHLHSLLHVGHRLMGQLLARPQRRTGTGLPGRDDPPHHVHADRIHQQLASPRRLHKSYRRVDWGKKLRHELNSGKNVTFLFVYCK